MSPDTGADAGHSGPAAGDTTAPDQLSFSFADSHPICLRSGRRPRRRESAPRRAGAKGEQPLLPFPSPGEDRALLGAGALGDAVSRILGRPVRVTVTDNRRTVLSWRARGQCVELRAHHMFLDAEPKVVEAVARWVSSRSRKASATIDRFVAANAARLRSAPRGGQRRPGGRSEGEHHDLGEIFEELKRAYFGDEVDATVIWGRRASRRRRRRSIRLGSYSPGDRVIRIHPALDQAFVPRFFVASVLYHEILHQVLGARASRGRTRWHSKEFRSRERAFPDFERAQKWEKRHIGRLLRS